MLDDERPGVEETYLVASNSSSLRVEADRRGDTDIIIAAGWTESRVGMALLRLHSEWDKVQRPRKPTTEAINALALTMPTTVQVKGQKARSLSKAQRQEMARQRAHGWYACEYGAFVDRLPSLALVRHHLIVWATLSFVDDPAQKVPSIITYWLDQTCKQCNGLKFLSAHGAPSLSAKTCRACNGTGTAAIPYEQEGRLIANYMDDCVSRAQSALKERLRGLMSRA